MGCGNLRSAPLTLRSRPLAAARLQTYSDSARLIVSYSLYTAASTRLHYNIHNTSIGEIPDRGRNVTNALLTASIIRPYTLRSME